MRIDPVTLKIYLTVIEERNFARAAERHFIATSAVSKRISDLEDALGVQLLERRNMGVRPTPAGLELVTHAKDMMMVMARMRAQMSEFGDGSKGEVRVFANSTAIVGFLGPTIRTFLEAYPQIDVHLEEWSSPFIVRALRDGLADLLMGHIVFLDSATLPVPVPRPRPGDRWTERPSTREHELIDALADADIAVTNKVPLRSETLRQLPRLRYICIAASGCDSVDLAYCRNHDIQVSNVPAYAASSVAEHVIGCIFMLRRQMLSYNQLAASSAWTGSPVFCVHAAPISDIRGATLGLIGSGAIGTEVMRMATALGMRVLVSERKGKTEARPGYTLFETVICESDVISLHCPLTVETEGLIGERELSMMRPTAVLINTARGALVDERALEAALFRQTIAGAALDVLQVEPPHEQHRFVTGQPDNLLLTPHVAWASSSAVQVLARAVSANVESFLEHRTMNRVA